MSRRTRPAHSVAIRPSVPRPHTARLLETLEPRQLLAAVPNLGFDYPTFADATDLNTQGSATLEAGGDALRLTPAQSGQNGSAFYADALALDADVSFSTSFSFQTNTFAWGGEGIVFLLQNEAPDFLGPFAGNTLGYTGATRSVAIEFDPRANNNDAVDHEVSVVTDGNQSNVVASAPAGLVLNSGDSRHAWIDYDGPTNTLAVFLSDVDVKPSTPVVQATLDLAAILGDQAYVGFTATTSGFRNTQDITRWTFGDPGPRAGAISVDPASVSVDEDAGSVTLTLIRTGGSDGSATVSYATADQTATAGQDYTGQSGDLVFADGVTSRTVTVPITDDALEEIDETFRFQITAVAGADIGPTSDAAVIIRDNDAAAPVGLAFEYPGFADAADLAVNADASLAGDVLRLTPEQPGVKGTAFHTTPVTFTGDNGFDTAFTLRWTGSTIWGGEGISFLLQTSGADYTPQFAGNNMGTRGLANSLAIELDPILNRTGDTAGNEVSVILNGNLDTPLAAAATDLDLNDGSDRHVWVSYDGPTQTLSVYLSDLPARPATPLIQTVVDLPAVLGGPAYAGFVATTSGFRNAQDVAAWSFEETTETVVAQPGALTVDPASVTVDEDAGTVDVTVLRTGGSEGEVSVRVSTANGTAEAGLDYVADSQVLTFADGQTSATFTVELIDDTQSEANETFEIALSSAQGGATLASPDRAVVTITDDDPAPGTLSFEADTYTVNEADGSVTVTVQRTNGTDGEVTVGVLTSDDSALATEDYTAAVAELTFLDGQANATVTIPLLDDSVSEPDEAFVISFGVVTGGATVIDPATATVTILDDDEPPAATTIDLYLIAGQSNSFGNTTPFGARKNDLFASGSYPELADQLTPYAFSTPDVRWAFDFPSRTLGAFTSDTGTSTVDRLNIPDPDPTPGFVDLGLIGGTGGVVVTGPRGNATSPVFGPELSLGRTLLEQDTTPDSLNALATFGVGGRSLWANPSEPDFNPASGELFDDMTDFFDTLIAGLEAQDLTVNVKGIAWVQGERDSKTGPLTGGGAAINYGDYNEDGIVNDARDAEDAYFDNLNLLIGELRARYGSGLEVVLPAPKADSAQTFAAYGSTYDNTPAITNAQQRVAATDPLVTTVDTASDFTFDQNDDGLHYTALGQINLGIALANAFTDGDEPFISL